jgi:hypothetical protein
MGGASHGLKRASAVKMAMSTFIEQITLNPPAH